MSTANDNAASAPLFIEIRPGMRKALADAVEAFLNLLDQIDADADLEDADPPEDDAPCEDRRRSRAYGRRALTTTAKTKASCLSRPMRNRHGRDDGDEPGARLAGVALG